VIGLLLAFLVLFYLYYSEELFRKEVLIAITLIILSFGYSSISSWIAICSDEQETKKLESITSLRENRKELRQYLQEKTVELQATMAEMRKSNTNPTKQQQLKERKALLQSSIKSKTTLLQQIDQQVLESEHQLIEEQVAEAQTIIYNLQQQL